MKAEIAVTASLLIIVLAAVRFIFRKKVSPTVIYALWLIAALRLLLPFSLGSSDMSVMNALPAVSSAAQTEMLAVTDNYFHSGVAGGYVPSAQPGSSTSPDTPLAPVSDQTGTESGAKSNGSARHVSVQELLKYVYLAGTAVTASILAAGNISFYKKLRRSRKPCNIEAGRLKVYVSAALSGPCLFGLFNPSVYLTPETAEDTEMSRHIIAHELTHYRHLDHVWGYVRMLCLVLHWYNPLVWLAASLSKLDGELACDAGAIKRLGEESRTAYGRTLIQTATGGKHITVLCSVSTLSGGRRSMKERISMIAKKQKTVTVLLCLTLIVAAVTVGCTFTGAKKPDENPETLPPEILTDNPEKQPVEKSDTDNSPEKANEPALVLTAAEQNAKPFTPNQAHDIVSAKLVTSFGAYLLADKEALKTIEEAFGAAETIGGATKCPFSSVVYLTRADGEVFVACPAEDSCAVLKADDAYYDYGGDSSIFWKLFDVQQSYTEYEYDAEGKVIKATDYIWQTPCSTYEYEYDTAGNKTEEVYTSGDKSVIGKTSFEYDAAGLVLRIVYEDNMENYNEIVLGYDENGNKISEISYDKDGKPQRKTLITYDSSNRTLTREYYPDGVSFGYREEFEYKTDREYSVSTYNESGQLAYRSDYICDNAGNCIQNTKVNPDGSVEATWEYTYGEQDGMRTTHQFSGSGALQETWNETYRNAEITVLSIDPADYGITADELSAKNLPNFREYSLLKLCAYYLHTDGAGAEGSGDELYRRFMEAPANVLDCILLIGEQTGRSANSANTELCRAIAYADVFWHDTTAEFESILSTYKAEYPSYEYLKLLSVLESEWQAAKLRS